MLSHPMVALFVALFFISISYLETISAAEDHDISGEPESGHIEEVFAHIDTDGNGAISEAELLEYFWAYRWAEYDLDHDKRVSMNEWLAIRHDLHPEEEGMSFEMFDEDKDGYLSEDEGEVLGYYVIDEFWLKHGDLDGDENITRQEFRKVASELDIRHREDRHGHRESFDMLDINGDGKITPDEFTETFMNEGWPDFDSDSDGKLSKDEFERIKHILHADGGIEFETFDEDEDGHLSRKEGDNLWKAVLDDFWMKQGDTDQDGTLSFSELRGLLIKVSSHPNHSEL